MTRYEAFIEKSWRTSGLTQLIVARIRDDGRTDIGFFLVDLWCLGVKDAFLYDDSSEAELRELLTERLPEEFRERFHPACAKKMIDGALAYAEALGFAPHRDYRKARRALSGLDATACPETFTFGRDGRPCYVEGPHDTDERTERILAILEARCGSDGFDCEFFEDEDDALDDARGALRMFFDDQAEDSPDFYEFAGLVAALHVCPTLVPPTQLVARLWGPAGMVWKDEDEAKDFMDDLGVYWNFIANFTATCADETKNPDGTAPIDIFPDDFAELVEPDKTDYLASAYNTWTQGFLRASQEWPDAWGDALSRPDLVPSWNVIRAWADPDKPEHQSYFANIAPGEISTQPKLSLPQAVLTLLRALRPPPLPTVPGA
ncbi:MAG: UPF0149 family protein [Verrucomicrobia bacterium]|nr:UPF0149 family protein [Verrucomicrobiota bacterium]